MEQLKFATLHRSGGVGDPILGGGTRGPRTSFPQKGGYWVVDFDSLSSFPVEGSDAAESINTHVDDLNGDPYEERKAKAKAKKKTEVPAFIQVLNGQKATVEGFMIPLVQERDRVLTFILAQSRMTCCYGITPQLNQWIYVVMAKGKDTEWAMDVPLKVSGILSVGKMFDQENKGWSLYRMVSDKVEIPGKSWF
jgi:hypothetical protein